MKTNIFNSKVNSIELYKNSIEKLLLLPIGEENRQKIEKITSAITADQTTMATQVAIDNLTQDIQNYGQEEGILMHIPKSLHKFAYYIFGERTLIPERYYILVFLTDRPDPEPLYLPLGAKQKNKSQIYRDLRKLAPKSFGSDNIVGYSDLYTDPEQIYISYKGYMYKENISGYTKGGLGK